MKKGWPKKNYAHENMAFNSKIFISGGRIGKMETADWVLLSNKLPVLEQVW